MKIKKNKMGFTLIELLVVISIIALLLAILMPSLQAAKQQAKRVVCRSKLNQLLLGWTLYAQDNNNEIVRGNTYSDFDPTNTDIGWTTMPASLPGYGYDMLKVPVDEQIEAIRDGAMYPYMETPASYRCPSSAKNEMRTYSCVNPMNGLEWFVSVHQGHPESFIKKLTKIRQPSGRMVFIDDFARNWDACWAVYANERTWWNGVPGRHLNGVTIGFADGHSESLKFKDRRTLEVVDLGLGAGGINQPGNEDLERLQRAYWGKLFNP